MNSKSEKNLIAQEFKKTKRELRSLFGKRKKEFRFDKIQNQLRQKKIFAKKNVIKHYGSHRQFITPSIPNSIRFSVTLASSIDANILTQCIYDVAPRFPFLLLSIKRGFFSYRLEETPLVPVLHIDRLIPASEIPFQEGSHLFRISYYKMRISIDVNLQLVDHNMARDFIMVLTNRYLLLCKLPQFDYPIHYRDFYTYDEMCEPYMLVPDLTVEIGNQTASSEQIISQYKAETATLDAADTVTIASQTSEQEPSTPLAIASRTSEQEPSTPLTIATDILPRKLIKLETDFVPTLEILELSNTIIDLATTNNCSLRGLVAGFLVKSIYDDTSRNVRKKTYPVNVAIISDLRDTFPTNSYRSFVTSISYKTCSTDAITAARILDERIKTCSASRASRAYSADSSFLRRIVPTSIRERCKVEKFSAIVYDMGEISTSGDQINRAEFVVGTGRDCPIACGIVRFNDKIVLSINSTLSSPNILKAFTDNLVASGIRVHLTTNRRNNLV